MNVIYYNGMINTLSENKVVSALYIENGIIMDSGSDEVILNKYPSVNKVDLNNKCVIPGFNDSHLHMILPESINLAPARSLNELIDISIKGIRENIEEDEWIVGRGWNHDYFAETIVPCAQDLDLISTTNPVCLIRACGHIAVLNSKALEVLNVDKDNIPIIEGGLFNVDDLGCPNGVVSEFALDYVYNNFSKPSVEKIKSIIVKQTNELLKQGITSVQSDDFKTFSNVEFTDIIKAYEELAYENRLNLRVYQQCLLPELSSLQSFLDLGYKTGYGDSFYRLGPLKLLLDGSLGARTAWMSQPYLDDPSTSGITTYNIDEFNEIVEVAHNNEMQIAVHGIGDGAIKQIIKSYEQVQANNRINDARHGIVHVQITEKDDLLRMAQENILAYVQPIFLHYDQHILEQRINKELAQTSYNFKTMLDLKIPTSYGTDYPVESFNPFENIYCAITRKDLNNTDESSYNEDQCVSLHDALECYTKQGAYASFEENVKGSLTNGMYADFIVLDQDIFKIETSLIKATKVLMSIVNGEIKYQL